MNKEYKEQVRLLLDVLPFVAEEPQLALHGGTAINLFVRDDAVSYDNPNQDWYAKNEHFSYEIITN